MQLISNTITTDNEKELAKYQEIAENFPISFYFCKWYHSWERGANENTNGFITQYIYTETKFSGITDKLVTWVKKKAVSDFKKLKPNPSCIADLMLFYIETGVNFTAEYGDMWEQYYTALENNFDKAMEFIYKNGYLEELRPRIEKMLKVSEECGWGFPDTLYDFYYQYQ